MRNLSLYRYNLAKTFARMLGQPVQRKALTSQAKLSVSHTEITQLPSGRVEQIQDLDPGSPTFGQFYYLPGYDEFGDPNHPIAP